MTRLRLLGYPVSNYVNIVRAALLEKQLNFEFVTTRASQDDAFRALSPMGKIPVLETGEGALTETVAILDYLDDRFPEQPLRSASPYARAKARQTINIVQLYVEAQVRQLFAGVFMGGANAPATEAAVRAMLDRATAAMTRLLAPAPFLLGDRPGQADLFAFYNLDIADRVTRFVYGRSIIAEIGGLESWTASMRARASTQQVLADFETYFAAYLADHGAAYRPADISGFLHHA
jgi:glutathione S-transferase